MTQALIAGGTGYGIGVGAVALWMYFTTGTNVRFLLMWQIRGDHRRGGVAGVHGHRALQ